MIRSGTIADPIVTVLVVIAAVAVNVYPLLYLTRRWWVTAAGRAVMVKAWGNLILIDMALAVLIFGADYPGRDVVRVVGMTVFTVGVWYLLVVLLRTPKRQHHDPTGSADEQ